MKKYDIKSKSLEELVKRALYKNSESIENKGLNSNDFKVLNKYNKENLDEEEKEKFKSRPASKNKDTDLLLSNDILNATSDEETPQNISNSNLTNKLAKNELKNSVKKEANKDLNKNHLENKKKNDELNEYFKNNKLSVESYLEIKKLNKPIVLGSSDTLKRLFTEKLQNNYINSKDPMYDPFTNQKELSLRKENENNLLLANRLSLNEKINTIEKQNEKNGDLHSVIETLNTKLKGSIIKLANNV
jgi:hypothetical protein